jgi:hypothetical protein
MRWSNFRKNSNILKTPKMDNSLKHLESKLEDLIPRSLSDEGRDRCHSLINDLVSRSETATGASRPLRSWPSNAAAAAAALTIGIWGGWYVGNDHGGVSGVGSTSSNRESLAEEFDQLDHEAWLLTEDSPDVYVTKTGEIREISREVEMTKEVVQHRESGVVVTVETTDHHVVDSVKSEF